MRRLLSEPMNMSSGKKLFPKSCFSFFAFFLELVLHEMNKNGPVLTPPSNSLIEITTRTREYFLGGRQSSVDSSAPRYYPFILRPWVRIPAHLPIFHVISNFMLNLSLYSEEDEINRKRLGPFKKRIKDFHVIEVEQQEVGRTITNGPPRLLICHQRAVHKRKIS